MMLLVGVNYGVGDECVVRIVMRVSCGVLFCLLVVFGRLS